MSDVVIAGTGMTSFGKFPDRTVRSLAEQGVRAALADAGATATDVEMVFFANAVGGLLQGQEMIRGQVALRHTGLLGIPMVNVENACASSSTAVHLACMAVASGAVDVALAVGAEKLSHPSKARSFAAIGTALDVDERGSRAEEPDPAAGDVTSSPFMDVYAATAEAYMARSGTTVEDFAEVVVKSHRHAALNPRAQYRQLVTAEHVLASRSISGPLTLLMCSPLGDGAAAIVVTSAARARSLGVAQPIRVAATALVSGRDDRRDGATAAERAAARAYAQAGLGPDDLDIVELHDAAAPAELIGYEQLRLCPPGGGADLLRSGATAIGGRRPVNTSGGLLSKGHPIGATGCAQLVELTDQLRGRAGDRQVERPRVGLAQNGGGNLGGDSAAQVVTILTTP